MPFITLGAVDTCYSEISGWVDGRTLEIFNEIEHRRSDGKRVDDLSAEEQNAIAQRRAWWAKLPIEECRRQFPTDFDLLVYFTKSCQRILISRQYCCHRKILSLPLVKYYAYHNMVHSTTLSVLLISLRRIILDCTTSIC